jgi:DNA-binding transcriptional MerR regulator
MDTSQLFTIGQFSNVTQLSVKALRLYADHGILLPTWTDAATGYRYYSAEQVHAARLIRTLRAMAMPLAQLAQCMQTPQNLLRLCKQHMHDQTITFHAQQVAYQSLLAAQGFNVSQANSPVHTVVHAATDVTTCTITTTARTLRSCLQEAAAQAGMSHQATAFVQLHTPLNDLDESVLEVCIPAYKTNTSLPATMRHVPAITVAQTRVHEDLNAGLIAASDLLFDWFDQAGKTLRHAPLAVLQEHTLWLAWPVEQLEGAQHA